ncbi:MAG TPA: hypothetical protein VHZ50_16425 [Puia sp.]|nr:hypothetical protein [Puia sp.]
MVKYYFKCKAALQGLLMISSDQPLVSNQIPISLDFPDDVDELNLFVQMLLKRIANATNTKESGLYLPIETATFISYFTPTNTQKFRDVYRKLFDMVALNGGPIPPLTTLTFPHNIKGIVACTRIYGTATTNESTVRFIPLPYVSQLESDEIEISLNPTSVTIANGTLTLNQVYIIAEYVKT